MRTTRRDGVATCRPCRLAAKPPVPSGAKLCTIEGCPKRHSARGYCYFHWQRWKRYGDPSAMPAPLPHTTQYTESGLRICKVCEEPKPESEYHKDKGGSNGLRAQCKDCRCKYMQGYYEGNSDTRREYIRSRLRNNKEHVRALDKERYVRDRDKRIELATRHAHLRRARLRSTVSDSGISVLALRRRFGDNCQYCTIPLDFKAAKRGMIAPARASIEHVLPLSKGGTHTWDNVTLICHRCNTSKNCKTLDEWTPSGISIDAPVMVGQLALFPVGEVVA